MKGGGGDDKPGGKPDNPPGIAGGDEGEAERPSPARRLKGFGTHLALYFGAMVVLVPVNFLVTPENPWFVLPMVGWGSVLAIHAAYVLGLFRGLFRGPTGGG